MLRKLIILLIRLRLGLKINEPFRFVNQRSPCNYYYFTRTKLMKCWKTGGSNVHIPSNVSINWILDDNCKIEKI